MSRAASRIAYLVAQSGNIGRSAPIYATVSGDPNDAVHAVARAIGVTPADLSFAGTLSHRMVRELDLKPGEVRRI